MCIQKSKFKLTSKRCDKLLLEKRDGEYSKQMGIMVRNIKSQRIQSDIRNTGGMTIFLTERFNYKIIPPEKRKHKERKGKTHATLIILGDGLQMTNSALLFFNYYVIMFLNTLNTSSSNVYDFLERTFNNRLHIITFCLGSSFNTRSHNICFCLNGIRINYVRIIP